MALLEIQYPIIIHPLFEAYGQDNFNFQTKICNLRVFFLFFFDWDSLHARLYETWSYKKKKQKKGKAYRKSVYKEPTVKKMSVNSRLKATKIMGQRKAFYRQRTLESSCARKETVDLDILVTSGRKIMHSIRIMSRSPLKIQGFTVHLCSVSLGSKIKHIGLGVILVGLQTTK